VEVAGQALAGVAFGDFHDLRHTGNHIAAATGVSSRELIGRMGHSITRAALIYQQRTAERDRLIASVMSEIADTELSAADRPSGTRPTGRILIPGKRYRDHAHDRRFFVERVTSIELALSAWEPDRITPSEGLTW